MTKAEGNDLPEPLAPPPIIFLICLVLGVVLEFVFPYPLIPYSVAQFSIGIALIATGSTLIGWSMIAISKAETTYDPRGVPTALVTSGPYHYSRNPGYLGLATIQIGIAATVDSPAIFLMTIPAILATSYLVINREEAKLEREFGHQYVEYKRSVGRWI